VDPRTGSDVLENGNISYPCRESNPGHPARSPSLYRLRYPGTCSIMYGNLRIVLAGRLKFLWSPQLISDYIHVILPAVCMDEKLGFLP
jgi:hypothetical protein